MREKGFTLIELMVTVSVLGILAAIAVPAFSQWLPRYRLKNAARDIYSNMQLAKLGAIKQNSDWAIHLDETSNTYRVCSSDGGDGDWTDGDETVEKTVNLPDYESGVAYGHGNATKEVTGGSFDSGGTTYSGDVALFKPRGTSNGGYVYIENNKNNASFAVGTSSFGAIQLKKWNNSTGDWE